MASVNAMSGNFERLTSDKSSFVNEEMDFVIVSKSVALSVPFIFNSLTFFKSSSVICSFNVPAVATLIFRA